MGVKITNQHLAELSSEESPLKWDLHLRDDDEGIKGEKQAGKDELRLVTQLLNDEHDLRVNSLCCTYQVLPVRGGSKGECEDYQGVFVLHATLRQTCVVTLERIETKLEEEFLQDFTTRRRPRPRLEPLEGEIEDPFAPEPALKIAKGQIEIGPLVYQHFSMAIDPNPRKAGASFDMMENKENDLADEPPSPFLVLKDYKHQK